MIVKCEQCQTRFKIPDDKVSDKGVKVRCTKCGNTFRVTRDMAQPPTGAFAVQPPSAPPPPGPEVDPFAKFGSTKEPTPQLEATRPGVFALGVEMTRMPERRNTSPSAFDFSSLVPPKPTTLPSMPAQPAPFDFSAMSAPPAPQPVPAASPNRGAFAFPSAPPPAAAAPAAFDFSTLTAPPPPAPAASPQRAPPSAPPANSTPAFDFSSLGALNPPPPTGFDAGSFDPLGLPPAPAWNQPPPSAPGPAVSPPSRPSPAPAGAALVPAHVPEPGTDDFFGGALPGVTDEHPRQLLDIPEEASADEVKSALFDMPVAPVASLPSPTAATELVPALAVPVAKAPVSSPSALAAASEQAGRRRTAFGIVINLVIAAVLVAALVVVGSALLNEGKLTRESLSFENLKGTFVSTSTLVASDISSGLYDTKGGRLVFFVRGDVTNTGASATRVSVQADIVEGAKIVRSAKGLAGAVPTAEELFNLVAADDLDKLNAKIINRAVVVEPGTSVPFLITFTEYPPDLKAFRVRVVASADTGGTTAQRP